jgi:dienelactone hydrolase
MTTLKFRVRLFALLFSVGATLPAAEPSNVNTDTDTNTDAALVRYLERQVTSIESEGWTGIDSLETWLAQRQEMRRDLMDMLGLWPEPERTDLKATVTGTLEGDGFVVEKVHFQSLPGLYVTANLYRPMAPGGPRPGILYACGHAAVRTNGVSCGNKTAYQHHGIWLARHGYVALLIDTLQLGEIEGVHHGTHRLGQWWWNARGYTPAGVEAWNSIRAIDYLSQRPEVDPQRLGMTGRSGGGSYTWTAAALDDRIRVAAPVAGITDLRDQVVHGVVDGHCDCMFPLNLRRWDFPQLASLLAPRPLLVVNTDSDTIFPLDGVMRVHRRLREVYGWHGASAELGLVIAPGPHQDTQDLQVPVLRWFDRHLLATNRPIQEAALKQFDPLALRVFDDLPADQRNTRAQEWFGPPAAVGSVPTNTHDLVSWKRELERQVFGGWPSGSEAGDLGLVLVEDETRSGRRWRTWRYQSQPEVTLELRVVSAVGPEPGSLRIRVRGEPPTAPCWSAWSDRDGEAWAGSGPEGDVAEGWLTPRGLGPGAWSGDERRATGIRRRYLLLGQTLDGMRIWDLRRGIQAARTVFPEIAQLTLEASGLMSGPALWTAVFEPGLAELRLSGLPKTFLEGPDYLHVLPLADVPVVVDWVRQRGVQVTVR